MSEALLHEAPQYDANIICYVPQNTECNALYLYSGTDIDGVAGFVCVTYNNHIGWISEGCCAFESEPYSQALEFTKDLVIEGNTVIKSGEIVKLYSKYSTWCEPGDGVNGEDYYFSYNGYNFLLTDLDGSYELDGHYVILFEEYHNLPVNQKLELKVPIRLL